MEGASIMSIDAWGDSGTTVLDALDPQSGGASSTQLSASAGEAAAPKRTPAWQPRPPAEGRVAELSPPQEDRHTGSIRDDAGESRRGFARRHRFGTLIGALLAGTAILGGYLYWDNTAHYESTDDAFIAARQFGIAPQVSGNIVAVPVTDNQHVAASAVIAQIDDRTYRAALAQDQAQVASAAAGIQNIDAQIAVQQAQIEANQAQVVQAEAALVFSAQQAARYQDLAKTGAGTLQSSQQWTSQLRQNQASLATAQANLTVAQRQIEALKAQRASAVANLAQQEAQRDQAALNLSYATVTAAQAGRVVQLSAGVGEYVQAGTDLTMFVPDDIWVTANYKETQLDKMRPGQKVTLEIDAYPERTLRGHIASVQPGSGTYVKIVQRVPVKIILDNPPTDVALGPGMSVDPIVRVDPNPSLYERLSARLPALHEQLRRWL